MDNFLPTDYKQPSESGRYFKFQDGLNRFRILTPAVTGYEYFTHENKPVRSKTPFTSTPDIKDDGKVKHFWAFVVWNYNESKIQIMEITQATIRGAISGLVENPKWGNPVMRYDIAVVKTGEDLGTKYSVQAEPPIGETDQEIIDAHIAIGEIDLDKLFTNDDPFTTKP